jgi:hypothetical protein
MSDRTVLLPYQPTTMSTAQLAAVSYLARYAGDTASTSSPPTSPASDDLPGRVDSAQNGRTNCRRDCGEEVLLVSLCDSRGVGLKPFTGPVAHAAR